MMRMSTVIALGLAALAGASPLRSQGLVGDALRGALEDSAADFWIYDDVDAGYAAAKKSKKPLLVSFRCVP